MTAVLDAGDYEEHEGYTPVSNRYIAYNRISIEDRLYEEQMPDLGDMAEYLGEHSGIGKKLIYAVWGLDEINGRLYGKIDCYLHFALNEEEIEDLRKAIIGQNSGR